MMAALDFSLAQHKQIVIAVLPGGRNPWIAAFGLATLLSVPRVAVNWCDQGQLQLARWLPLLSIMRHKQGRTTGYICENYICILPTSGEALGLKQRH